MELDAVLAQYRTRYATFKELAERVARDLEAALTRLPFKVVIDHRAKAPSHVVLKVERKLRENPEKYAEDPLGAMGDLAGVRVVAPYLSGVQSTLAVAREVFDVIEVEDIRARYKPHELGYLGLHAQVRLRESSIGANDRHLSGLQCEIQIHTKAQNAWSEVSHPLLYKPVGAEPSVEVQARILRAVALVSLFDDEVAAARDEILGDPLYRPAMMLDALSKAAIDWRSRPTDDEVSIEVLAVVAQAYDPEELERFDELIDDFMRDHRQQLELVLTEYVLVADEHELLFQPEAIAIYERLKNRGELLRHVWRQSALPYELLVEISRPLGLGD